MTTSGESGREVFSAARWFHRQAAVPAVAAIVATLVGLRFDAPLIGLPFVGGALGGLARARHRVIVVDDAGVRLPTTGLVPWEHIEGVEIREPQTARWSRMRPLSRLHLRLASLPEGWFRVRGSTPGIDVPVVDDEDALRRSIEQRLRHRHAVG